MSVSLHTPFDDAIEHIRKVGFHNQRKETHSDVVSLGILHDLLRRCDAVREDFEMNKVGHWQNMRTPGARGRRIDLLVAEPKPDRKKPDLSRMRLCVENKSVVTAHRNADARYDDLNESLQVLHKVQPEAVLVATVLVGVAERVLNIPDRVKALIPGGDSEFERTVLQRLSTGDAKLWDDFPKAISPNKPTDPQKTIRKFRTLTVRPPGHTHVVGYDYVLLVPVGIDNVNPPYLARENSLGIDIDKDYQKMLERICTVYQARWHTT